jgi:hypothetical protein
MQDCPGCRGRGAVDLVDNGRKVWGAQCPECHGQRVVPYRVVPDLPRLVQRPALGLSLNKKRLQDLSSVTIVFVIYSP